MSIETSIIGIALQNSKARIDFNEIGIEDGSFTDQSCKTAWKAIRAIENDGLEVNLVSVGDREPSLAVFLIDCLTNAPTTVNHKTYAEKLIKSAWIKQTSLELKATAALFDNSDEYEQCRNTLVSLLEKTNRRLNVDKVRNAHMREVTENYLLDLEKRVVDRIAGKTRGISTGIKQLDELVHGWMPSSMNILAARTSMGKTTLALNFANHALNLGKKVLFFTNEMPSIQIAEKLISLRSGVFNHRLFNGNLEDSHLEKVFNEMKSISTRDMFINERSGRNLARFVSDVRKCHEQNGIDLVILDYIQQMNVGTFARTQNRALEIAEISGAIKELALELGISFICLAQCNRQAENKDEPPTLANIRDSGAIEQDADTVIFIHRERERLDGQCELVIAKNRFGPLGTVLVQTDLKVNKFF